MQYHLHLHLHSVAPCLSDKTAVVTKINLLTGSKDHSQEINDPWSSSLWIFIYFVWVSFGVNLIKHKSQTGSTHLRPSCKHSKTCSYYCCWAQTHK